MSSYFQNFYCQSYSLLIIAITNFYPTIGIILHDQSSGYNYQPTSLFNHVIRHQTTLPHRYISITTPQPILSADAYLKPSSPDIITYETYDVPIVNAQFRQLNEVEYIVNGRILKQYLVMEDLDDDNSIDSFLNSPQRHPLGPFLPPNFNIVKPNRPTNLGFPIQSNALRRTQSPPAVALGSGSLGYIRLPNGSIFIGSGSLGYIDSQQRANDIQSVRNRQSPRPSPLSFGQTPN